MVRGHKQKALVILGVSLALLVASCSESSVPRNFTPLDTLILYSDLPAGWKTTYGPGPGRGGIRKGNNAAVSFSREIPGDVFAISHESFRFPNSYTAQLSYERDFGGFGQPNSAWTFRSKVADEQKLTCSERGCWWAARYQEYVVNLGATIRQGEFDLSDMERLVRIADDKITRLMRQ